jgi:hypothetical protein
MRAFGIIASFTILGLAIVVALWTYDGTPASVLPARIIVVAGFIAFAVIFWRSMSAVSDESSKKDDKNS